MAEPRKGTFEYMVRDVASSEGWTEAKAKAILRDGIDNGHRVTEQHRKDNERGIERMRDEGRA